MLTKISSYDKGIFYLVTYHNSTTKSLIRLIPLSPATVFCSFNSNNMLHIWLRNQNLLLLHHPYIHKDVRRAELLMMMKKAEHILKIIFHHTFCCHQLGEESLALWPFASIFNKSTFTLALAWQIEASTEKTHQIKKEQ